MRRFFFVSSPLFCLSLDISKESSNESGLFEGSNEYAWIFSMISMTFTFLSSFNEFFLCSLLWIVMVIAEFSGFFHCLFLIACALHACSIEAKISRENFNGKWGVETRKGCVRRIFLCVVGDVRKQWRKRVEKWDEGGKFLYLLQKWPTGGNEFKFLLLFWKWKRGILNYLAGV